MITTLRLSLAALVVAAATAVSAADKPSVHVLCYHGFVDKKNVDLYFSIDELKSHIKWLKDRGFRFIGAEDFAAGRFQGQNNVLVTIDDGNKSVYAAWEQVFRPNGIRPVLAIFPNIIGRKPYALTWDQVKRLSDAGCTIAAHGYYHEYVNQKLYDKRRKDFLNEIYGSKQTLEEKTGKKVDIFIYPFGVKSPITVKTLRDAGYRFAFTIHQGGIEFPIKGRYNPLELPRYMMAKSNAKSLLGLISRNKLHRGLGGVVSTAQGGKNTIAANTGPAGDKGRDEKKKGTVDGAPEKKSEGKQRSGDDGKKTGLKKKADEPRTVKGDPQKKDKPKKETTKKADRKKDDTVSKRKTAVSDRSGESERIRRDKELAGTKLGREGPTADRTGSKAAVTKDGELVVPPRWRDIDSAGVKRTTGKKSEDDSRYRALPLNELAPGASSPSGKTAARKAPEYRERGKRKEPNRIKIGFKNYATQSFREYSALVDRIMGKFMKLREMLKRKTR